jgi:hypothetical protein
MRKKKQRIAEQFSDGETERIKRYGQALSGGVSLFDVSISGTEAHPGMSIAAEYPDGQTVADG